MKHVVITGFMDVQRVQELVNKPPVEAATRKCNLLSMNFFDKSLAPLCFVATAILIYVQGVPSFFSSPMLCF